MAGRPKKRGKKGADEGDASGSGSTGASGSGSEADSWAADLTAQLMGKSPVATGAAGDEPAAAVLAKMAAADREFLEGWWRDQVALIERRIRERAELQAAGGAHPSDVFANQAMQFGAMGIPRDVAARLMGLTEMDLEGYYGREYALGAAEVVGQVAANLIRIAVSSNDRYAVKAAVEVMNR